MRPKIIPIQKFENKFDGGEIMYANNNICNGKNKDSFQNDEWNWKMVGSIAINNIIKKQFAIGSILVILLVK